MWKKLSIWNLKSVFKTIAVPFSCVTLNNPFALLRLKLFIYKMETFIDTPLAPIKTLAMRHTGVKKYEWLTEVKILMSVALGLGLLML